MFMNVHNTFDAESIPLKGRKNKSYGKSSNKTMCLLTLPNVAHKCNLNSIFILLKYIEIHWVQSFTSVLSSAAQSIRFVTFELPLNKFISKQTWLKKL